MITNFQILQLPFPLKKYVERMFLIESSGRMPSDDLKLIVPNACAKLVIPFRNGLTAKSVVWNHVTKQDKIAFIGISDVSAVVDYSEDGPAGNITVEFSPIGLYRFFNLNLSDAKNQIFDFEDLSQKLVYELQEKLGNTENTIQKIKIVQQFLLWQLSRSQDDPVFDYCVQQIIAAKGKINIADLEKYTGFSGRWLNIKFREKIGLSPKSLSSIIRFQQYYQSLVNGAELFFLEKEFYNYYYDQAHFIKDFKRFTGHSPLHFSKSSNSYDKVFYRE